MYEMDLVCQFLPKPPGLPTLEKLEKLKEWAPNDMWTTRRIAPACRARPLVDRCSSPCAERLRVPVRRRAFRAMVTPFDPFPGADDVHEMQLFDLLYEPEGALWGPAFEPAIVLMPSRAWRR